MPSCGEGSSLIPATMSSGKYADLTSTGGVDSIEVGTEVGVSVPSVRTESVCLPTVKERRSPPSIPHVRTPNTIRINKAGIAAMAHFTMKMTIEKNGIRMSVTTTAHLHYAGRPWGGVKAMASSNEAVSALNS